MKELLDKLSSYNLFNYLFPGVVFVSILNIVSSYNLIQENIIVGAFLYYFIGLLISRIGSVLIEPILKFFKIVQFSKYSDYVKASQKDPLLSTLSEANNMYRTLCSMFVCIFVALLLEHLSQLFPTISNWVIEGVLVSVFLLFIFSYRKQTMYISKRVDHVNSEDR